MKKLGTIAVLGKALSPIRNITAEIHNLRVQMAEDYFIREIRENPKYQNPKKLTRYENQVFSQNGEDGIISEIFKRIGTESKYFVEFGVGNGLENNTVCLLFKDYTGCWIEANADHVQAITQKFGPVIRKGQLKVRNELITAENIETLFRELKVPEEFDLLSIDIDGNDYWVWKAIENYHPRVLVIEYNALFPPDINAVIRYNPHFSWGGTFYFGASLKALEILGAHKGYRLVGCDFKGVNAFFVRQDLIKDNFLEPFTAENHYEPHRFHLIMLGRLRDFGDFVKAT